MISKTDHERAVVRTQDFLEEDFQVLFMLLFKMFLAAAHVHDQCQGKGQVRAFCEELNLLRGGIFEQLDVVPPQIVDERAFGVAGREGYVDQVDVYPDGLLRWRGRKEQGSSRQDCREHSHEQTSNPNCHPVERRRFAPGSLRFQLFALPGESALSWRR